MLASIWTVATREMPPQVSSALAPIAAIAADAGRGKRDLVATFAGRPVAALVISRGSDGHGVVDLGGGLQVEVAANLPAPGTPVYIRLGSGAQAQQLAAPADSDSTLVEIGAGAASLGKMAGTPVAPLQLGSVAAPITQPAQWAAALAGLVRDSGAFYEAHLAAWTQGQYPLARLQREPQGGAATAAAGADPSGSAPATATAAAAVAEEWRPLVREQLHALEHRSLPCAIEAWPGQRADLVISADDDGGHGRGGATPEAAWNTSLKLTLPRLGGICARLALRGDRLWLDIDAPSAAAADLLDGASLALTHALGAAGVQLVRARINHDPG
jgi:hypothetical protein